jgi:acylaminoacyl-peptidase
VCTLVLKAIDVLMFLFFVITGGFLAGHCIGQHPNLFKVAAMRNPCTNIASMVTATDIPDWCYIETLGPG